MMTVDEIMSTDVHTLKESNTIDDARALMTKEHVRHIPIVDDDGRPIGLVTQRDILAASESVIAHAYDKDHGRSKSQIPLSQIMTRDVSAIDQNAHLRQAAIHLQAHKYGCLPVVDNGKLKGIVTDSDFVAVAINLLEQLEEREPEELFEETEEVEVPPNDLKDWD
ncbi:MAG: CBS domain-containing protein [Gammaproteobacteria bacterium]|nr:CBS domain-containing protein [Gammaproteobacteria bacterium]